MTREIELTRGKIALVDDEDYGRLSAHKWRAWSSPNGKHWYARREVNQGGERWEVKMHRQIVNANPGVEVDHVNGNGLDNRKGNLRVASSTQNKRNKKEVRGVLPYKGVGFQDGKIVARIKVSRKQYTIGEFATAREAATAYDATAIRIFGEFACTNAMMGLLR